MKNKIIKIFLAIALIVSAVVIKTQFFCSKKLTIAMFTGSYWDVPEQDSFALLQLAIDNFCQDRDCQIEYVTGVTQDRYEEWLAEKYLKNEMPDLFFVPNEMFSTYVSNGMLMELDTLIEYDETFHLDGYYDVSLDAVKTNGQIYALPYASSPQLTLVNSGLLEDLGLEVPLQNWTWDDMIEIYQSVKDNGENISLQSGYTWELAAYATEHFFINEEENIANFADEEMISLVSFFRKIYEADNSSLSSNAFENDNVIFQPVSYSAYKTYTSYPYRLKYIGTQWTSVCLPMKQEGTDFVPVDTISIGIYKETDQRNLAWEFLKYLTTDYELQKQLMMQTASVSVLKDVLQDEELQQTFSELDWQIDFAQLDAMMQNGVAASRSRKYNQVVDLADSTMHALIGNEQDIENNLIVLNREITEFLSQYYK